MRKFICILLVIVCLTCLCTNTSAANKSSNVITIESVEVIFSEQSTLTHEQKYIVAEHLVYGIPDNQTYGLLCNVFGHKYTTEYATTITHCVNSTAPRCLEEYWQIQTCSRCDNVEGIVMDSAYIDCCS